MSRNLRRSVIDAVQGAAQLGQANLGPADDKAPDIGDLFEAFDDGRLSGQITPLPGAYAMIPAGAALTLPQYGGHGCTALNIVPTDYVGGQLLDPAPADFNPRPATIKALKDLAGRQICFIGGTGADEALAPALRERDIKYIPFPFEEMGEMEAALVSGHCAAITADVTQLANMRAAFLGQRNSYSILPDVITSDPVAPAYPAGDSQWGAIVDWTLAALIQAEASGVTAANIEQKKAGDDPVVRRLLGTDRGPVLALGLDRQWTVRAIQAAGNFGEVYDRDVGMASPLKLARGLTALWSQGGLLYPMPIR